MLDDRYPRRRGESATLHHDYTEPDTTAPANLYDEWLEECEDVAAIERVRALRDYEARIEREIGFDAVLASRYCRYYVTKTLTLSVSVRITDGRVDCESTRRDELLNMLQPYNEVLNGHCESYAAWVLRRVLS